MGEDSWESIDFHNLCEKIIQDKNIMVERLFLRGGFMIKIIIHSNICPIKSVIGILAESELLH